MGNTWKYEKNTKIDVARKDKRGDGRRGTDNVKCWGYLKH